MGWCAKLAFAGATGIVAGLALKTLVRQSRWFDWSGARVIVTGGSRGLGLVLARQLVDARARVAICARTEADVRTAVRELQSRGGNAIGFRCDVRDEVDVDSMMLDVVEQFGGVDVLINVAGTIEVGPFDAMTQVDFEESMNSNCWSVLRTTRAVLPLMREQQCGRIVNIASLGGKRAVPHMLPYTASKFALVGLSNGLRAELAKDGIWVTTICPSLMRTGSPRNATFKGQHRKEYAWFSIGDALPLASMSAEKAAAQIMRACQYGDREVILSSPANIAVKLQSFFPGLTQAALTAANRLLPEMGGIGTRSAHGYHSESGWSPSLLTVLNEQAASRNNEMRPRTITNGQGTSC